MAQTFRNAGNTREGWKGPITAHFVCGQLPGFELRYTSNEPTFDQGDALTVSIEPDGANAGANAGLPAAGPCQVEVDEQQKG